MSVYAWGSNGGGQLGQGAQLKCAWEPRALADLEGLNVCKAAAGDGHTVVVTEGGDVYAWGRGKEGQLGLKDKADHDRPVRVNTLEHETIVDVACGAFSTLAITANGRVYQFGMVHKPISEADAAAGAASGRMIGMHADPARRETLETVMRWSTNKWAMAEEEASTYYEELAALGYTLEEAEEKAQGRNREYHGMLQVVTRRYIQPAPELVSSLSKHKIVMVSAGYAHSMAVSDTGKLFACGYNDRGQLGLGHRINVADFHEVEALSKQFVVQVVCGQAHNLARVAHHNHGAAAATLGCQVYVWGNGTLGQLGLGRKGTGKGRLYPTLLNTLPESHQHSVIDIGAGGNFSICVCDDGSTFSWGHAEYNQHGSGGLAAMDYVDPYFFYVPRLISSLTGQGITHVTCGSCFTLAMTDKGDVFSWGWNAYGVLGHGEGHYSPEPCKITALGGADRQVVAIASGAGHSLALTTSRGHRYAATYRPLLDDPTYADVQLELEDSPRVFYCHGAILEARSRYLRGMLEAARADAGSTVTVQVETNDGENLQTRKMIRIGIYGETAANPITVHALLTYIYTDSLAIPAHKRVELYKLAQSMGVDGLADLCGRAMARSHLQRSLVSSARQQQQQQEEFRSTFLEEIGALVNCPDRADVVFTVPEHLAAAYNIKRVYAHQCILARLDYFHTLFRGKFAESLAIRGPSDELYSLSMEGFLDDGIEPELLLLVLRYLYTGDQSVIHDPACDIMSLLVAANRVGLWSLVQLCEKELSLHLTDFPENVHNCYEFAQRFNVPRLERQCQEILEAMAKSEPVVGTEEEKG